MKPSDFCITNTDIPISVMDNIYLYHLKPLELVNSLLTFNVFVSYSFKGQPSGYRPYVWEIARGRSGRSQHTFGQRDKIVLKNEKGATDITCDDFKNNKDVLLKTLIENTDYLRLAVYDTFIHADYKDTHNGKRLLFTSDRSSRWTFKKFI